MPNCPCRCWEHSGGTHCEGLGGLHWTGAGEPMREQQGSWGAYSLWGGYASLVEGSIAGT